MSDDLTAARYGLSTLDCLNTSVRSWITPGANTDHVDDQPVSVSGVSNPLCSNLLDFNFRFVLLCTLFEKK